MTVAEAIRHRKSVRDFENRPVPQAVLERVLESTRLAPSARNAQEWRFVLVTDAESRQALAEAAHGTAFVAQAPMVVVACAATDRRKMSCGHLAFLVDVSIAIDHLTLAAVEEGLGTCWIGGFDADAVRSALDIPPEIEVVEIIPIGYPRDPSPVDKNRLPMDEIIHRERWL